MREAARGLTAAAAAVLVMVVVAGSGLALLGAGRIGDFGALTAAAVAMAVGGSAEAGVVPPGGLAVAVRGGVEVVPLGISLAGAVVLGALLLRRREAGLLVRGAVAVVALPAGLAAIAVAARGTVSVPTGGVRRGALARLPGRLDAGFAVAVGPAVVGALAGSLVVVGICLLVTRFPAVATGLRAVRWPVAGLAVLSVAAAWTFGGSAAAGAVLLALPLLVCAAVLLGLGVPWTLSAPDVLPLPAPGGALLGVSAVVLLGCGIAVAAAVPRPGGPLRRAAGLAVRLAPVAGAVLAVVTLLSRLSVDVAVSAFGLSLPVFDARLTANPLLALVAGLAGGAAAGFAGSLLADGFSVFSRTWKR
ncbi:streptophobe family protein [Amycolatopsis sp. lyj-346]|uniref:streptophobe family protein n=1 Tax=Amycolatopsis sp. lyj-346 TaxID=2789289 RepID=UPI00397BB8A6